MKGGREGKPRSVLLPNRERTPPPPPRFQMADALGFALPISLSFDFPVSDRLSLWD